MSDTAHHIGHHIASSLKGLRQARGWSLAHTARETGVSKAMLGQIERGESSPTVATLWRIASGFRVSFSSLFGQGPGTDDSPLEQRHCSTSDSVWGQDSAGMQAKLLFPYDPLLGFEMFEIELAAGAESASSPHAPGVVEHLVVLEGTLVLAVGDEWHRLTAGEGLRFCADRPHLMRNEGPAVLRFHDVIHYLPGAAGGAAG
ncbi:MULTISPECIES: helix-turn-helix domain-containing protein [Halomonas]|uniref:helix-turn-helix domain-containing protein n=1 Tax=Halomonas TaxID=2745 RepID=UPI001C9725A8|nr:MULTISPECIES: XRE family transcriptional regulator [Halomonas]MEE3215280.1 XRE family transcriptional regulator [Pseudomonadota bacterium]MBY5925502.1 XRE family transcriptional regulator [Halomonas sp. DP4Y7-2]MBY5969459.1 XRE family transcriptional regulator [Halomonas denitrificans]MBY5985087.1 XRE family transcriptional regulator [Halomonas sp. DP5Y7-2]MBY6232679.1 XRE family transcriptional regulator [Halomonas sp. DP4Y7-1]